ncbi:MAG: AraC family transcriptional regulator [Gemmatimonadetes bacterium]|nr:AraC family transcriptional regulator [Gemmatimonadota bacterium]
MSKSTRQVFICHADPEFQQTVRSALQRGFSCWTLADWRSLRETARDAAPTAVAIVDPCAESRDGNPCLELKTFLAEFSWLPVIAAVGGTPAQLDHLLTLGRWGVSEVIVRGMEDTPAGIRRAVRFAQGKVLQAVLEEILPAYLSGRVRRILFAAAEAIGSGGHAPDLAASLGVTETTVMRRCERLRLPPPRRVLAWVRVILAARLLDQPGRTSQSVASACGYATEAGLRRVLQNFLGMGVTELRSRGALDTAARAFLHELRGLREGGDEGAAGEPASAR